MPYAGIVKLGGRDNMDKVQEYLNISKMWYGKAKEFKGFLAVETNHGTILELTIKARNAALKGWQFESKARDEMKDLEGLEDFGKITQVKKETI